MANNGGDCTAYLSESLTARRTASHSFDHASLRRLPVSRRGPHSPLGSGLLHRIETVFQPPTMTNALHEVLTRGQNRPRNGGSSTENLAACIALGRAMPDYGIFLSRYIAGLI